MAEQHWREGIGDQLEFTDLQPDMHIVTVLPGL